MCAIQKISFHGESLLKNGLNLMPAKPTPETSQAAKQQSGFTNEKKMKAALYVSSALALTSLGVAGVVLSRNFKAAKNTEKLISEMSSFSLRYGFREKQRLKLSSLGFI